MGHRRSWDNPAVNWLLKNFGPRLRFALHNPLYAASSLYREITLSDERFLSSLIGVSARSVRKFLNEPVHDEPFATNLQSAESLFESSDLLSADLYAKKVLLQYAAVRAFAPDIVVETGVASGVSSSYLLLALHKNGRGKLYSIELGDERYLPPGKLPGWIVPDSLKSRWELRIGDSRELLPKLLAELGTASVFIHDSLHTYEQMLWEYRVAYPFIKQGGLLISDDAAWNPAFPEFCAEVRAVRFRILRGVGFLQKGLS
jgi:predicted O-methyltransferase YrrM